jgi:RNA ligase (TIGR02306 family)
MSNIERVLASVVKISNVEKHSNADTLDVCTVDGWKVITKIGEFRIGDFAVYITVDAFVPNNIAPFLTKNKAPREYLGIKGEVLKTTKLRGLVSQGLLLSIDYIIENCIDCKQFPFVLGADVSEVLGIVKYDPPLPAQLSGIARGNFPVFIPKTDLHRCQSLVTEINDWNGVIGTLQEKLDGSSCTIYINGDDFGVCSRNLNLQETEDNSFWNTANKKDIINKLKSYQKDSNKNIALQLELCGPGIQKNIYKLPNFDLFLFDIYDIDNRCYWNHYNVKLFADHYGISHVPVLETGFVLNHTTEQLLSLATGTSKLYNVIREGIVFKSSDNMDIRFKAISNEYLLKYGG